MSQNKYMHPRNIYKCPPDFKQLAINFPEFRKHTTQELSGKVSIDFKDPAALRALTTTLLLKDFHLKVDIPLNRLIPTLPLRLNYVLWIEDLILASSLGANSEICGIDIGTGASCIYPLLIAKTKGWHMLATEIDESSVECAKRNVETNSLKHLIEVKKVERETILKEIIDEDKTYDFTMCNPPFFANEQEITEYENRTAVRKTPSNSLTGTVGELVFPGGELAFIKKMVQESLTLRDKIKLFTTMVGHKSNVMLLKKEILDAGAHSVGSYELCQGRTTRWVLAWTFYSEVKTTVDILEISRKSLAKPPFKYLIPEKEGHEYTLESFSVSVKKILNILEMEYTEIKKSKSIVAYAVTAWKDTWSKQRQKRRAMQRKKEEPEAICNGNNEESKASDSQEVSKSGDLSSVECRDRDPCLPSKRPRLESDSSTSEGVSISGNTSSEVEKCENVTVRPLLKASLVIRRSCSEIFLELTWLDGSCGRDTLHQVFQYFKNHLME
ncbi:hypothetical protein J437_LFUL004302 [Ladona fulva]|uniref:U6 small nuclear RNA (adenine-(43)-N(6))-methyltransferase n=1 Tax=Ladona fulva TaxID=123851 RepID=A0A8K0NWB6_LADFU|nr:hypothetical protein J437_LFUL004302 [Ladona fulva]